MEDRLDPELLVSDPSKSLRQKALKVTTPNGYLMYSQVTLEVLDGLLRLHGGDVDTPWAELSEEARRVVLYGSERQKVVYGKHTLESRMKWTGITPRPRTWVSTSCWTGVHPRPLRSRATASAWADQPMRNSLRAFAS